MSNNNRGDIGILEGVVISLIFFFTFYTILGFIAYIIRSIL